MSIFATVLISTSSVLKSMNNWYFQFQSNNREFILVFSLFMFICSICCGPSPAWNLPTPISMLRYCFAAIGSLPPLYMHTFLTQALTYRSRSSSLHRWSPHLCWAQASWTEPFLAWMVSLACLNSDTSSWAFFPCGLPPQHTPALKSHTKLCAGMDTLSGSVSLHGLLP